MTVFNALSGLFGGLVGAILTYWLGIRAEATKAHQRLRTEAYIEFIEATAAVAISQKVGNVDKMNEAVTNLTQAKSKIAVYGSAQVASAIADFFRKYGSLASKEAFQSFAAIVALMRAETPGRPKGVPQRDLEQILFGQES